MFRVRRPESRDIDAFLQASADLPLSYEPVGIARGRPRGFDIDEQSTIIGSGEAAFARAMRALTEWHQFALGWVELHPQGASIEPGTVVAVLVRHLGFWSLNGCRVVYGFGDRVTEFGVAYGTLTNHSECGEEIFAVRLDRQSGAVTYTIRAVARPRALLARVGYPMARMIQHRFRVDSGRAMERAGIS